jgi:hypothetical protein
LKKETEEGTRRWKDPHVYGSAEYLLLDLLQKNCLRVWSFLQRHGISSLFQLDTRDISIVLNISCSFHYPRTLELWNKWVLQRQARSRESSGLICRLSRDGPDHPHLDRNCLCLSQLIEYWMGISLSSPLHRLS